MKFGEKWMDMSKEIKNELLDDNFISYSLSSSIVEDKAGQEIRLNSNVLQRELKDISYVRHQQAFYFNHLTVDSKENIYFIDVNRILFRLKKQSTNLEPIFQIPYAPANIAEPDQPSICVITSSSSMYAFLSDGEGQLFILELVEGLPCKIVFSDTILEGQPFTVLSAHKNSEDGTVQCIVKYLTSEVHTVQPISSSTTSGFTNKTISFVQSEDQQMSEQDDKKSNSTANETNNNTTMQFAQPSTLTKVTNKYFIELVQFKMKEGTESASSSLITDSFWSEDDVIHCSFDETGTRFVLFSNSAYTSTFQDEKPDEAHPIMDIAEPVPISPQALEAMNQRLAKFTSEEEEIHPTQRGVVAGFHAKQEAGDEDDEYFGLPDSKSPEMTVFTKRSNRHFSKTYTLSLSPFQLISVVQPNPKVLNLAFKYGIDAVIFHSEWNNSEQEPIKFQHTTTFDAFGFVWSGKQKKIFCSFTQDSSHATIAEIDRFVYVYKRKNERTDHKSIHQLLELQHKEEILGMQVTASKRILLLTKSKIHLFSLTKV